MSRNPDLHPYLAEILDAEAKQPPLHSLAIAEGRARNRTNFAPRLADFQPACSHQDIDIPGPDGDMRVRLLTPDTDSPLPIILFLHGGGWAYGDLDIHTPFADTLAAAAHAAVLMVDYRLAPEHPFPAALEDVQAALDWLWPNAQDHGLDNNRLALAGDSAGGNLAAILARGCRDRGGPPLRAQYLACPIIDLPDPGVYASYADVGDNHGLTQADIAYYWGLYAGQATPSPDLLPLTAPLEGLPPALIHTAQLDVLRSEGEAYAIALEIASVPTTYHCWPGMTHGFLHHVGRLEAADVALAKAGRWLAQHLG